MPYNKIGPIFPIGGIKMSNITKFILFNELTKDRRDILIQIKNRVGRRTFPEPIVTELIVLGLVAGDYSKLYVTDKGDDILGVTI